MAAANSTKIHSFEKAGQRKDSSIKRALIPQEQEWEALCSHWLVGLSINHSAPLWIRDSCVKQEHLSAHRAVLRINTLTIMKSSVTMAIGSVQMLKERKVTNLPLSYTKNIHNSFKKVWSRIKPHNLEGDMTVKQFPAKTLKKQEMNRCTFFWGTSTTCILIQWQSSLY